MSSPYSSLPAWVYKRDGRLAPFDPDEIALRLFEATEKTGNGNPFLARELTESALFFLGEESTGHIPSTSAIAEVVAKVVRELGHPGLAKVFLSKREKVVSETKNPADQLFPITSGDSPATVIRKSLSSFSLNTIFSRDLVAAQEDGWITLHGLSAPLELFAGLVDLPTDFPTGRINSPHFNFPEEKNFWLIHALENTRSVVGGVAAFDGPEHILGGAPDLSGEIPNFFHQLEIGLRETGLQALLNLNCLPPPAWAEAGTDGPLFAPPQFSVRGAERGKLAELFLEHTARLDLFSKQVFFDWHLSDECFQGGKKGPGAAQLGRLARLVVEQRPIAFTFDRPRQPIFLGPGLDRKSSTALIAIDLHLPRLLEFSEVRTDPELFLKKIPSLVRLAVSAGAQKRTFLRDKARQPDGSPSAVNRRFLLARSRLLVIPVGLEAVVRELVNRGLCESPIALQFGQTLLKTIKHCLQEQAKSQNLLASLGGLGNPLFTEAEGEGQLRSLVPSINDVPDLTPWDALAPLLEQLRAAGKLHPFGERATATLIIPHDRSVSAEEVAELLWFAWKETAIQRLQFRKISQQQLTLPGL